MAKKGEKMPEDTKRKISEAQKGKPRPPLSPEMIELVRNKRSESMKKVWASGGMYVTHSEDSKAKISMNRKGKCLGNTHGFTEGFTPWNKGRSHNVHSPEWRAKVSEANAGPNHWNWKGGINSLNRIMRNSRNHKDWARAVHDKCNWTCQDCGYRGRNIVAHHIKPWSLDISLRFDVANGVTLCRRCHCSRHLPRLGTGKSPKPQ